MKRLSTVLLTSTLALSMITPVVATGVEGAKVEPTTKIEEVAKEAAKKVEEEVKEVKEEATEAAGEVKEEAAEVKEEVKEKVEEVTSEKLAVKVSPQKVTLDGKEIKISGYNIKGENYFKLRDLAAVFKDTDAKFSVDYKAAEEVKEEVEETEAKEAEVDTKDIKKEDVKKEAEEKAVEIKEEATEVKKEVKEAVAEAIKGEKEEVKLTKPMILLETGKEYEVLDTDLKEVKAESTATKTKDEVKVNGENLEAKAFKIDGNNYYRLRDLGAVLNFGVDYDKETNTVVLTSKVEEKAEVKEEDKKEEAAK
ncbi:hypothetical protein [Peptoniphilus stercorisuis]|uniref:Copper amine oxidase N-terminal domain n=1 Tax=Peptoniphilus stercorisuis TaxID=1436965 RepID=A0ABS4KG65_9FIRM|nr:hypothetical protein [Peptoniphilus stercorisuis]MBP2025624.1 hypothetical protein [Peptoniphilus stercorisuis]